MSALPADEVQQQQRELPQGKQMLTQQEFISISLVTYKLCQGMEMMMTCLISSKRGYVYIAKTMQRIQIEEKNKKSIRRKHTYCCCQ